MTAEPVPEMPQPANGQAETDAEFIPHHAWKWNEHGGWEEVGRLRLSGYFARVEDEDGDRSTWNVSLNKEHVASGVFEENEPEYHFDKAIRAAEEKLRELGVL